MLRNPLIYPEYQRVAAALAAPVAAYEPARGFQGGNEQLVNRRGLRADLLVQDPMGGERRRGQRRNLVRGRGTEPGGRAGHNRTLCRSSPSRYSAKWATAADNISGCVVTNDMNFLLRIQ